MDPWHDYLALPVAPLLLLVQVAALFIRRGLIRWSISVACTAVIAVMFAYVASLPLRVDEGVKHWRGSPVPVADGLHYPPRRRGSPRRRCCGSSTDAFRQTLFVAGLLGLSDSEPVCLVTARRRTLECPARGLRP